METSLLPWLSFGATAVGALFVGLAADIANPAPKPPSPSYKLRCRIVELIRGRPGARLRDLWRDLGTSRGTTQYHLLILERVGAVQSVRIQQSTRYFPPGLSPDEIRRIAILLRGRVLEIAREVVDRPGIGQNQLVDALSMSRKVFRAYADLLVQEGLLDEHLLGGAKRYFPTSELERLVDRVPPGPDEDAPEPSERGGRNP